MLLQHTVVKKLVAVAALSKNSLLSDRETWGRRDGSTNEITVSDSYAQGVSAQCRRPYLLPESAEHDNVGVVVPGASNGELLPVA